MRRSQKHKRRSNGANQTIKKEQSETILGLSKILKSMNEKYESNELRRVLEAKEIREIARAEEIIFFKRSARYSSLEGTAHAYSHAYSHAY